MKVFRLSKTTASIMKKRKRLKFRPMAVVSRGPNDEPLKTRDK